MDVCVRMCMCVCGGGVCVYTDLSYYSVDFNRAGLIFFDFFVW